MKHTQNCTNAQERQIRDTMEYAFSWPNHCHYCGGEGYFYSTYDPSAAGVSLSPGYMTDVDPCPECTEKGKCPRCGENTPWDDGQTECQHCGYDVNNPQAPPDIPECYCWENEMAW